MYVPWSLFHRLFANIEPRIKTSEAVKTLFDQVKPCNGTPTGAKLEHLLRDYLFKLEKAQKKMVEQDDHSDMRRCKPVNFIVITDGAPSTSDLYYALGKCLTPL